MHPNTRHNCNKSATSGTKYDVKLSNMMNFMYGRGVYNGSEQWGQFGVYVGSCLPRTTAGQISLLHMT